LGFHSKVVVTGDVTQVDLPPDRVSGLIEVREILKDISGIEFVYFDERDVVRHRLVQDIIKAYDQHASHRSGGSAAHKDGGRVGSPGSRPSATPPSHPSKRPWGQPH